MKAVRWRSGRCALGDAPEPVLNDDDALVRVYACGVTPAEAAWSGEEGRIPGHEVSGVVERIAGDAGGLRMGDEVYGLIGTARQGAAAEFAAVPAAELAPKPRTLDHAQSAAVPYAALAAWQALFDRAGLVDGMRVLIPCAAGGVGAFAVQLARRRGAHVTAMAARADFELLRELGANRVIEESAPLDKETADVVLDTAGGETLKHCRAALRKGGVVVSLAGPGGLRGRRRPGACPTVSRRQLVEIARAIDEGAARPVVEAVLPLERAEAAFEPGRAGHHCGKLVLRVAALGAATR